VRPRALIIGIPLGLLLWLVIIWAVRAAVLALFT
jgi:hypothetical protein